MISLPHATSSPSRILRPTEQGLGTWLPAVLHALVKLTLASVPGADGSFPVAHSPVSSCCFPGLTPMFSLLVSVSSSGQWVDSHLATFISSPAQAGTGTGKFKINKGNEGRKLKRWGSKDGISRTSQQKSMIIWGLRCFPQNCTSRAAEYFWYNPLVSTVLFGDTYHTHMQGIG